MKICRDAPPHLLVAAMLLLAACSDDPEQAATGPGEPSATAEPEPEPSPPATPAIEGPALSAIAARVAAFSAKLREARPGKLAASIARTGHDAKVLRALYAEPALRSYAPDGNLSDDGAEVMELLGDLDRHGVDRRGYRLSQIDAATEAVVAAFKAERAAIIALGEDPQTARVATAICAWIRDGEGGEIRLVRAARGELSGGARKLLGDKLEILMKLARAAKEAAWKADLEIARAVIRYVVDFKFAIVARPYKAMTPSTVRGLASKKADRIRKILAGSRGRTAERLRSLWPTHPQYKRLLGAVDRYRALVDNGGWDKLPKAPHKKIERGYRGPWISKLRQRLRAEGYDCDPEGDTYDKTLRAQVIEFQARHQLKEDGVIGRAVIRELNVSASHRLKELGLALQRLREAEARDPEDYCIWVNISAQRVQVLDKGRVVRTHRVIVGKDNDDIDYSAKLKGKINRTKMFTAKMTKVTLAPRWYPTPRVVDIELGPALARDPDYYEKQGYVSEMQEDGTEVVYQKSGPTNLLGRVKFQFPNKYAIYMHDTPGRSLFKRARRAYSHGCIRMRRPMKMAYFILGRDQRKWTRRRINKVVEEREEKVVYLNKKIPVHIDYVSATVEGDGKVYFWSDIYGYDVAWFTGQLPVEDVEEYEPKNFKGIR